MFRQSVMAYDAAAWDAAIVAGAHRQLVRDAAERYGIAFDESLGEIRLLRRDAQGRAPQLRRVYEPDGSFKIVCDAQPELVTASNAGIPQYLTNVLDPRIIDVAIAPMNATKIVGEQQKGNWLTTTIQWKIRELTGEVSSYGDFNNNGNSGANLNFPTSDAYYYQIMTQWGQREAAEAGLAGVEWAASQNEASVLALNKFQNQTYFRGVAGLRCYGMLNHPSLQAPIAATAQWNAAATGALTIYEDIRRMFVQIQVQTLGVIDMNASGVIAMSNIIAPALLKTNEYGLNVMDILKKNFPNMRIETAPEYTTDTGELVQMILDSYQGQPVCWNAYTSKLMAHNMVVKTSSWEQKKSQGTLGFTLAFSPGIAQMTGV